MNVASLSFLLFVLIIWLLVSPIRSPQTRQLILLFSSYLFYASWGVSFLVILIVSSLMNYGLGLVIRRRPTLGRLGMGVAANVLLLAIFKYLPHLASASAGDPLNRIVMPVGISFWTFQAISYLTDLYREEDIEPSIVEFSLYMSFWPTVLSGPVCRLPDMLPQFRQTAKPTWDDVAMGARRIVVGLFMKVVLAQFLMTGFNPGEGVASGFDQIARGWSGIDVWLLAIGFGFQLFFDFAGYSHIVVGTARLFGIRLAENFDRPFFSSTPSVFWTRWHMSLSFWIRDYLFLPLAAARRYKWWRNVSLILAMTLFGLWHDATLTFILWGAYHGSVLVAHRLGQQWKRNLHFRVPGGLGSIASWAITFAAISLGWILFRSHDLTQAAMMLRAVVSPASYGQLTLRPNFYIVTPLVIGGYFLYCALESFCARFSELQWAQRTFRLLSPIYYSTAIFLIIVWSNRESVFVYFQF